MLLSHLKTWIIEEFLPLLVIASNITIFMSVFFVPLIIVFTCYKWTISVVFWLGYYLWVWYDARTLNTGGRKIQWLKYLPIFDCVRNYYPLRLIKTADIAPDRNYLFVCFPHGIIPNGSVCNIITNSNNVTKLFPEIDFRFVTFPAVFLFPIAREYFMALGGCTSGEANITYLLNSKPSKGVVIFPGGTKESLNSHPGAEYTVVKNNRKGFIRIALKTGASLVPVFSFGEQNLFEQEDYKSCLMTGLFNIFYKLTRAKLNYVRGRGFLKNQFGLLPHRRPVTTVVGEPLPVPKVENPSPSLIDEYHEKFYQALQELFEKNKDKYDEYGTAATLNLI